MRRFMLPIIALSLAAAPVAVEAQTPRAERGQFAGRGGGMVNPAERVLEHREALGLSLDQVRQLQQLQAQIATRNQPLLDQLQAARPQLTDEQRAQRREARLAQLTPEQRAQMEQRREQMATATPEQRQQMRQEMRQRMEQLTPAQRAEMRQKARGQRGDRGERGERGQRARNPEARAQMEALQPVMQQLRQSHEQAREQVHAVLTAEQTTRLRELMSQRRGEGRARR
jgi:hypothetical protein